MTKEINGKYYKIVDGGCDDCSLNGVDGDCNIMLYRCEDFKCYKEIIPKYEIGDEVFETDSGENVKIVSNAAYCKEDDNFIYLVKCEDGAVYHSNESELKSIPENISVTQTFTFTHDGKTYAEITRADEDSCEIANTKEQYYLKSEMPKFLFEKVRCKKWKMV